MRFAPPPTPSADRTDALHGQSPLERFRTAPQKPLSVTDLVSPSWCELQYWYSLTTHGRKRRTPAMRQGSAVHKVLEEQVYQTVAVDVQTREDHWGLKLWNVVQGLRTLRATGMTRELEVWGLVDGVVVNGVIDELSLTCADPEAEARLVAAEHKSRPSLPVNQSTISDFFAGRGTASEQSSSNQRAKQASTVYLTDVKTRVRPVVPKGIASIRPTYIQLMLYRRLLTSLVCNSVQPDVLFERYSLNSTLSLSDSLIAQLSNLEIDLSQDATLDELLGHNTLSLLWDLTMREFQLTFPSGAASVSRLLRAEYRSQNDGAVLGAKSFVHDDAALDAYLSDEMRWWRGEREAKGVEIEEAFKCQSCDFAEGCAWRVARIGEATSRSRQRAGTAARDAAVG